MMAPAVGRWHGWGTRFAQTGAINLPARIAMGQLMNFVTPLHKRTRRDYLARMMDDKVHCMLKAKEYERDYWDGDRRYGYGGYRYDGRWKPVAQKMIDTYRLKP